MHLIVGIDPGTTTGVAVLDFHGNLVDLFSSKDMGMDRIIQRLVKHGRISVIATDVTPVPSFVSKLAAQVGAVVQEPKERMSVSEKLELTRPYKAADSHQRDSLAAALSSFNFYKNKFQKIDSLGFEDEVKHMVIRGYPIEEAARMLRKDEQQPVPEPEPAEQPSLSAEERRIRQLEKINRSLSQQLEELRHENHGLREQLSSARSPYAAEVFRDKEIRRRDSYIEVLQKSSKHLRRQLAESEQLRRLWEQAGGGRIQPVGVFPQSFNGFSFIRGKLKKKDMELLGNVEVAFTDEASDLRLLADSGVLAAGTEFLRQTGGCFYIRVEDIKKLAERTVSVEKLVEDYRKERR